MVDLNNIRIKNVLMKNVLMSNKDNIIINDIAEYGARLDNNNNKGVIVLISNSSKFDCILTHLINKPYIESIIIFDNLNDCIQHTLLNHSFHAFLFENTNETKVKKCDAYNIVVPKFTGLNHNDKEYLLNKCEFNINNKPPLLTAIHYIISKKDKTKVNAFYCTNLLSYYQKVNKIKLVIIIIIFQNNVNLVVYRIIIKEI